MDLSENMTDHAAAITMRKLTASVVLYAISSAVLVSADCYRDHDWSIAMIEKQTYWTAIPHDGQWHDVEHAQCLAMETKTCVPCSSIIPDEITFTDTMSPCSAYFAKPENSKFGNLTGGYSDFVAWGVQETLDTGTLAFEITPPRRVLALKCGN